MIICGPIVLGTYALIWIQHAELWIPFKMKVNAGWLPSWNRCGLVQRLLLSMATYSMNSIMFLWRPTRQPR